jgi:hypothetical protein
MKDYCIQDEEEKWQFNTGKLIGWDKLWKTVDPMWGLFKLK